MRKRPDTSGNKTETRLIENERFRCVLGLVSAIRWEHRMGTFEKHHN